MIRPAPSTSHARSWSREILEQELGRVHAREFANLLCRAAMLRARLSRAAATRLCELGLEDGPVSWRCAARRAQRLAEIDGFELAGHLALRGQVDGTKRWAFVTGGSIASSPAVGPGGTIYVGSQDNYLYSLTSAGALRGRYLSTDNIDSVPAVGSVKRGRHVCWWYVALRPPRKYVAKRPVDA